MFFLPIIVGAVAAFGVGKGAADGTLLSGGSSDAKPSSGANPDAPAAPPPSDGQPKEQTVNEAVAKKS